MPALIIAVVLAVWEAAGRLKILPDFVLPAPSQIWTTFQANGNLFKKHVPATAFEALLGFGIGNFAGVALAVAFVHSPAVERSVYPMAVAMRSIPFVASTPILVIWLGNGLAPKIVITSLVSFFPTLVNAVRGLRNLDPEAVELMHTLNATWWQVLWKLRWPSSIPFLFSALKISAAGTVIGAIVAEWIGSDVGLGYLVLISTDEFKISLLWATIAVSSAMALLLFGLVILAERFWSPNYAPETT